MSIESFLKGWLGERGTNLLQHLALDPKEYHLFYDLLVGEEPKRTQIDHVIVSKFGIFAVETKNDQGWIYGHIPIITNWLNASVIKNQNAIFAMLRLL